MLIAAAVYVVALECNYFAAVVCVAVAAAAAAYLDDDGT